MSQRAAVQEIWFEEEVRCPSSKSMNVSPYTAVHGNRAGARSRPVSCHYKIESLVRSTVEEGNRYGTLWAFMVRHGGDLLAKYLSCPRMLLCEIAQDFRQSTPQDLEVGHQTLLFRIACRSHLTDLLATAVKQDHPVHPHEVSTDGLLKTRNLVHDRYASCPDVDILATWPKGKEALDDGHRGAGFGEPVCGHGSRDRSAGDENAKARHVGCVQRAKILDVGCSNRRGAT